MTVLTFLISHYALNSTQSSFRPKYFRETALLQMINKVHEAINNWQIIGMVTMDFRKTFGLVDHIVGNPNRKKMHIFGFVGSFEYIC